MVRPLVRVVDRLQRLAIFEAAARLGSFSAAARELGLSQPAVTRQIRALERSLDVELFVRTANTSVLSGHGQHLATQLDASFAIVEGALADIAAPPDLFVLAAPPGFAQQLIVPHLDAIAELTPDTDLRLWLYDRDDELTGGVYDLAVRVGDHEWAGFDSEALFDETVIPVAAPAFADEHGLHRHSTAGEIFAAPLLHAEAEGRPWASWEDWLAAHGIEAPPSRRRIVLNNYPTVLQQAIAGRGVALGWRGIVDDLVADGVLTELGSEWTTSRHYYVSWPSHRANPTVAATVAWLRALAGSTDE